MMRVLLWSLTFLRIALIPAFLYFATEAQEAGRLGVPFTLDRNLAWGTLLVMGISDVADGWLARRFGLTSQLGAMMDAVADKLVQFSLTAFFTLSVGPVFDPLPMWFFMIVFGRDLVLGVGVSVLRARYGPIVVVHRWHGRLATVLVFGILVWIAVGLPIAFIMPVLWTTAGLITVSSYIYARNGILQGRARS